MKANRLLQAYLGLNRNVRILGTVALLLLGGLAIFIASRQFGDVLNIRERIFRNPIHNTYFTSLIASGAVKKDALKKVEDIFPYASGFIGLSRKKLTLREARELADRTGAEILDVAVTAQKSRKELTTWLTDTYPSQQGSTVWVRDNLATKTIDCPDVLEVTTTKANDAPSSPSRQVFLRWPKTETWPNKGWSWTIQPQFDEVTPFSRWGLARVRSGKAWGVIDEAGRAVQPPTFDTIEPFEEQGSARVSKDGKWGLLDRAGKLIAPPEWEDVQHFINGFIPVKKDEKWGYLDATGKLVIPCEWEDAWRFSPEGFAVVTRDGKRGFIDKTGKVIVEPVWDGAINFAKEGVGMVRRRSGRMNDGWSLVTTAGELLCQPEWTVYWQDRNFESGYIPVSNREAAGFLGLDGRLQKKTSFAKAEAFVLQPRMFPKCVLFSHAESSVWTNTFVDHNGNVQTTVNTVDTLRNLTFFDGLSLVVSRSADGGKLYGFVSQEGTLVIPPDRGVKRDFACGLAASEEGGKWGFIDRTGKVAIKQEWNEVKDFREGFAAVRRDTKWGFQNTTGKLLKEPAWNAVGDFCEGFAAVQLESVPSEFEELYRAVKRLKGYYEKTEPWGFIEPSGKPAFGAKSWLTTEQPQFKNGCAILICPVMTRIGPKSMRYSGERKTLDSTGREVSESQPSQPKTPNFFNYSGRLRLARVTGRGTNYQDRYGETGDGAMLVDTLGGEVMGGLRWDSNPDETPYGDFISRPSHRQCRMSGKP